ncbi:MAG: translation initiation factor [Muribaculaceae bacterium]|nr:translation initiation factor [Muribaculaceae bacterium]
MDWKDLLSQMKDSLPEGDADVHESNVSENAGKSSKKEKLSVTMERKGRGGKTATIIFGFEGDDDEVAATASRLKQRLGIGGSSRGGEILLQGDVREKVKPILKEMGYRI